MSEPNFYTTKFSTDNLLAIEMRKTKMLMNKHVYLGLSILELSKILILNIRTFVICNIKIWWKNKIVLYGYR